MHFMSGHIFTHSINHHIFCSSEGLELLLVRCFSDEPQEKMSESQSMSALVFAEYFQKR
jgi:hypothetical protein